MLPQLSSGGGKKITPEEEEDSLQPDGEGCVYHKFTVAAGA